MLFRSASVFFCILGWGLLGAIAATAGDDPGISQKELLERIEAKTAPLILDVRSPEEYAAGHIPGSINIPHDLLQSRLSEITAQKDEEIVVHCRSGYRAGIAEDLLRKAGFSQIRDLEGHMVAWEANGYPVEAKTD